jgi:hypothetical protein
MNQSPCVTSKAPLFLVTIDWQISDPPPSPSPKAEMSYGSEACIGMYWVPGIYWG